MFKENMEKTCCDVRFRLIFTDLNMPNLDGISAARQIMDYQTDLSKAYPKRNWVPIIAVTAYEDEDTVTKCLEAGISQVINKPVNV